MGVNAPVEWPRMNRPDMRRVVQGQNEVNYLKADVLESEVWEWPQGMCR